MSSLRQLFVGINGGHHRSTAVAYEPYTSSFFSVRGAPINCHCSASDHACGRLSDLLSALQDACAPNGGSYSIERLILAVPGAIDFREERNHGIHLKIGACLTESDAISNWEIVDDTWAGLYAETGTARGICGYASAGTSVCIAPGEFSSEKKYKVDGWGPIIGDFGSSFDIVVDFFRQLGRRLDRGESSPLFHKVKEFANSYQTFTMANKFKNNLPEMSEEKGVQVWFDILCNRFKNGEWRSVLSALAAPILTYSDDDSVVNNEAIDIIEENARRFADSIVIATEKFEGLPVILQGGLVRNCSTYRNTVQKYLNDRGISSRPARAKTAIGALMLAVDGLREESGIWKFQAAERNGLTLRDRFLQQESVEIRGSQTK
jgi:N-acetylglucosamine kinase-like BadF-type ATPase